LGLLFPGPDGGPVWPSTVRAELAKACEVAGITPPVRPNELRHTFATIAANSGLPPHVVADVLGHTTTRMVDLVYRHRPDVIRGAEGVKLN
jgi:integrase